MRLLALALLLVCWDGVLSVCQYGDWRPCHIIGCTGPDCCGTGVRNRTGNTDCDPVNQTVACDIPCPHPCVMTHFTPWTICNQSCVMDPVEQKGYQYRTRQVIVPADPWDSNDQCETSWLQQNRTCNEHKCPYDCVVSDWGAWTTCNKTCGGGYQSRTRTVTVEQVHRQGINATCPPPKETLMCNISPCPINCNVSDWGAWSECSATCGPSERRRTRFIRTYPQNNGTTCPALEETESCMTYSCDLEDLRWECKEKDKPTFLTVADTCPYEVVYCPGGNGVGTIKPCPSGMAFSIHQYSCRPESELCTNGTLNPTPTYPPWYRYPYYTPGAPPYQPPTYPPFTKYPTPPPAQPPAQPGYPTFLCKQTGKYSASKSGNCGRQYWWCTAGQQAQLETCPDGWPYFKSATGFGGTGSCVDVCP